MWTRCYNDPQSDTPTIALKYLARWKELRKC